MIIKDTSYYGLLDVQSILAPVASGQWMQLPYFPGHYYAAYKASESKEVICSVFIEQKKEVLYRLGGLTSTERDLVSWTIISVASISSI